MKKIVHEIVTILVIVLAMYLISSSGMVYHKGQGMGVEKKNAVSSTSKENQEYVDLEKNRYNKLKKAKEELNLYRLLKKNNLMVCVGVELEDKIIDINTATAHELCYLKGIGKSLSKRIIEYRIENGIFTKVEDLIHVKGIGQKKLSKLVKNQ